MKNILILSILLFSNMPLLYAEESTFSVWMQPTEFDSFYTSKSYNLESAEFLPISGADNIQSIKVLSLGDEFRKVMAVRVNPEKFGKGIA